MRIAYIGNFEPSHSTENHVATTLEAMGHIVTRIQENHLWAGQVWHRCKEAEADMLLWTRTWQRYVDQDDLSDLKRIGVPTVSLHLDLYVGISREPTLATDPFWRTEYVFTPDGDPHSAEIFKKYDINHHYLPAGVFYPECVPGDPKPEFAADVIFIGSYDYHPEWPYRKQLIDWLKETYGDRFKHYGNPGPNVRGQDLNDALASAKVVIGDSLCKDFSHTYYWSDRVYETTGRGGFIIHPDIKGLEEEFVYGKEIETYKFGDFDGLKEKIDYYLTHDKEREAIREAGHIRTSTTHTYEQRLNAVLEVVAANVPAEV